MKQCRLWPAKLWSIADFAPQNHGDFILFPAKLWRNANFALKNHGDIVSGALIPEKNILKLDFL